MKFETLEDYEKELKDIEKTLKEMEEYLEKHPEKLGTQGNHDTLKYVYNILQNDKIRFIEEMNKITLQLKGDSINEGIGIINFTTLTNNFYETEKLTTKLLDSNFEKGELLISEISEGSLNITFAFTNPSEEDVKRISPRKKGLIKIFDLINCGEDIEKLKEEAGSNGEELLPTYKGFLTEIIKNNADFTLSTEKGILKAGLTLDECKNICENLNI